MEQTADVDGSTVLGPGTSVWYLAQIHEDTRSGLECIVDWSVYVSPSVVIGDRVKLANYALAYEPARLEDDVFVGPAAVLTNNLYPRSVDVTGKLKRPANWHADGLLVRKGASLGARGVVVPGCPIDRWALIISAAVVTKDVPDFALVAGVPNRRIGWVGRPEGRLVPVDNGRWLCHRTSEI